MSTELMLMKGPGGVLLPADEGARAAISMWPVGQGVKAVVSRARNIRFHRKFFAMLNLAYDAWEPREKLYQGQPAKKSFERFRKDLLVLAGFYTTTVNLRGQVRLEPESIAFGNMDEDRFNEVYNRVADVILARVLKNYTRADLDRVVEQLMAFL